MFNDTETTMTTYRAKMPWGTFRFSADLAEASAPICTIDDDGERHATQYQTADARHRDRDALRLALRACGRDVYADPNDRRYEDEILDDLTDEVDVIAE